MKNQKDNNRILPRTLAIMLTLTVLGLVSMISLNVAAESPWADTWNGIIDYGIPLAAILFIIGIFAAILTFSKDVGLSPNLKIVAALVMVGSLVMGGLIGWGVVVEPEVWADVSDGGETGTVSWTTHYDDPNTTTICDFSDEDSLLWKMHYNLTTGEITNSTDTITLYFTLSRADQLDQWAYTDAEILNIDRITDATTGAEPYAIRKTTNKWDVNWHTRDGDAVALQSLSADSIPTGEVRGQSFNITIFLNDLYATALYHNGQTYGSFDIRVADTTIDCMVQLYNTYA